MVSFDKAKQTRGCPLKKDNFVFGSKTAPSPARGAGRTAAAAGCGGAGELTWDLAAFGLLVPLQTFPRFLTVLRIEGLDPHPCQLFEKARFSGARKIQRTIIQSSDIIKQRRPGKGPDSSNSKFPTTKQLWTGVFVSLWWGSAQQYRLWGQQNTGSAHNWFLRSKTPRG